MAILEANIDHQIRLTKRELEVLRLASEGYISRVIAGMLYVSKRTIDFHLARIYEKLQVSNKFQALRRAKKLGFIPAVDDEDSKERSIAA